MIIEVFNNNPTVDLLNKFYSEFVRYNNTDGKSLGIVLTPSHIVELMVRLLDINSDDVILDLCTGTGSYLIESYKYKPRKLIGCEYQTKLYNLFKCNLIIRDIKNCETYFGDCFDNNYKATKSIINPPYATSSPCEIDFIIKQLDSIIENGIAISIIPISILSNIKKRNRLIKLCKIITIIKCNEKSFYPNASVNTCIIIIEKNKNGHNFLNDYVNIIDFRDDNIIRDRNNFNTKNEKYELNIINMINNINTSKYLKLISIDDDWIEFDYNEDIIDINELHIDLIRNEYYKKLNMIMNKDNNNIKLKKYKTYKLFDLFDIEKNTEKMLIKNISDNKGNIPYISSSGLNNGIVGYVKNYTHVGNCITIAKNGTVGTCFYQTTNFTNCNDVIVIRYKEELTEYFALYICRILENKLKLNYSYSRKLNMKRLNKITINLPIKDDNIDYDFVNNLFS